jgi:hypothetical protein
MAFVYHSKKRLNVVGVKIQASSSAAAHLRSRSDQGRGVSEKAVAIGACESAAVEFKSSLESGLLDVIKSRRHRAVVVSALS